MSKKLTLEKQMERLESAVNLIEATRSTPPVPEERPVPVQQILDALSASRAAESRTDAFNEAWELAKCTKLGFSDEHKTIFELGWEAALRMKQPSKETGQ